MQLMEACRGEADVSVVEDWLVAGKPVDQAFPMCVGPHWTTKETALAMAARHGQMAAVELLLDAKADVEIVDTTRFTALMHAAYEGHLDVVKALVAAGADVAKECDGLPCRRTALDHAKVWPKENAAIIEYLTQLTPSGIGEPAYWERAAVERERLLAKLPPDPPPQEINRRFQQTADELAEYVAKAWNLDEDGGGGFARPKPTWSQSDAGTSSAHAHSSAALNGAGRPGDNGGVVRSGDGGAGRAGDT